jgi:hypothetical protein
VKDGTLATVAVLCNRNADIQSGEKCVRHSFGDKEAREARCNAMKRSAATRRLIVIMLYRREGIVRRWRKHAEPDRRFE